MEFPAMMYLTGVLVEGYFEGNPDFLVVLVSVVGHRLKVPNLRPELNPPYEVDMELEFGNVTKFTPVKP